jgi:bifunctional non-homologous end joining protein LigD
MLAVLVEKPFDDPDWVFETKYDGYRALAAISGNGKIELYSRNLISFNDKYAPIVKELKKITHQVIIDGEVVVEDRKGVSKFQLLQNYMRTGQGILQYYVFDLLHLDGISTREFTLLERKELLEALLTKSKLSNIKYSAHIVNNGKKLFIASKKKQWEGIIAKHSSSIYLTNKRSAEWLKIKNSNEQEAIILGITAPGGARKYFGSLVLGAYHKNKLIYIGNCGTGFTESTLKELYQKFKPYFTATSPFTQRIVTKGKIQWMRQKFVCGVKFTEWTKDLSMRHPVFLGLRIDKKPKEVKPELPK